MHTHTHTHAQQQSMRVEQMRQVQSKLEDTIQSRIGVLENAVQQQDARTSNLVGTQNENDVTTSSSIQSAKGVIADLQRQMKQLSYKLSSEEENRR